MSSPSPAPTKPSRESLIAVLHEAGLPLDGINAQLIAVGYPEMTKEEANTMHLLDGLTPPSAVPALPESPKAALKAETPSQEPSKAEKSPEWSDPAPSKAKLPLPVAKAAFVKMRHAVVDVLRAAYPEKYLEYRAIKYPGNVESMATSETRRKAYSFAFDFLMSETLGE